MASSATEVEEIPIDSYYSEDEVDSPKGAGLRRSYTDAHLSETRPQLRVRFHSLPRLLSEEDEELLGAKAHQLGFTHLAGRWQNTVLRKRRKGWTPVSEDEEVLEIARAMENDDKFMADDVDGEVRRREGLREFTRSLKMRKKIKDRLIVSRTIRARSVQHISQQKSSANSLGMKWFKFKEWLKVKVHDNSLWTEDLKVIEGMYGTSVGSYFRFLRFLFLLNSFITVIIFLFLMLPEMLFGGPPANPSSLSVPKDQILPPALPSYSSTNRSSFGPMDWLTGSGWLSATKLYYGGYSARKLTAANSTFSYDMAQTYFYTITSCFTLYLILILVKIFTMYRQNYIDTEPDLSATFSEKVFSAWDFHIADEKSALVKHRSIYNELMEMLQEYLQDENDEGLLRRFLKRLRFGFVWFVLLSFLLLLGWGLYLLLKEQLYTGHHDGYWSQSFYMLVYPMLVTLLMVVIPMVFEAIGRMENYSKPRYELYATLIRVFVLELVILVALVVFWYENSPGLKDELGSLRQTLLRALEAMPSATSSFSPVPVGPTRNSSVVQCWETALGEEIYRLVLIDMFLILVSTLVVDSLKPILVRSGRAKETLLEFRLPPNTLHLIYNQTLLWAGIFFCPLLPLVIALKFALIFYLQKWSVTRNLRPMERPFRASQTETLFYSLTLLSLILAFFSFGFIIARGYSSPSCGPFRELEHYIDVVLKDTAGESKQMVVQVLTFFIRPGFVCTSTLGLCILVYAIKTMSDGTSQLVGVLRRQLRLETKDRVFLQRLIEQVKKGEYSRPPVSPRSNPTSPIFPAKGEGGSKRMGKKSSFVFSRNTSVNEDVTDDTSF